ncbi:MAG: hypothetical protein PHU93_04390 [Candidatus Gracilibacteria bacterium]|nr:hypothetical protein [Candidatus Gracilibacteria bacterium]
MVKKTLVIGDKGIQDAVASQFGVLDCVSQLKTSRVVALSRQQTDLAARKVRKSVKLEAAMRQRREEREKLEREAVIQAALAQANSKPGSCKKLLKQVRAILPLTHKIALVPAKVGFMRTLVRPNQAMTA